MKVQLFFFGSQNIFGGIAVPLPDRPVSVAA
jgi:hypothetical protein